MSLLRKTSITTLILISLVSLAVLTSNAVEAQGRRYRLTVANGSSRDIHRLHMSSSRTGSWGPDMLGRSILRARESRSWDVGPGEYDILFIDIGENQCVKKGVMIFNDASVSIADNCF